MAWGAPGCQIGLRHSGTVSDCRRPGTGTQGAGRNGSGAHGGAGRPQGSPEQRAEAGGERDDEAALRYPGHPPRAAEAVPGEYGGANHNSRRDLEAS